MRHAPCCRRRHSRTRAPTGRSAGPWTAFPTTRPARTAVPCGRGWRRVAPVGQSRPTRRSSTRPCGCRGRCSPMRHRLRVGAGGHVWRRDARLARRGVHMAHPRRSAAPRQRRPSRTQRTAERIRQGRVDAGSRTDPVGGSVLPRSRSRRFNAARTDPVQSIHQPPVWRAPYRSFQRGDWEPRHVAALLARRRYWGWPIGRGLNPRASDSIRDAGDGAAELAASPHSNRVSLRIVGKATECVLPTVAKDQIDRVRQTRARFVLGTTLAVCARHFRTVRDVPVAIPLQDRRERVAHQWHLPARACNFSTSPTRRSPQSGQLPSPLGRRWQLAAARTRRVRRLR